MIITIDGPAGSGKSTISKQAAKELNILYLDTGAMYRAVAFQAKQQGVDFQDGKALGDLCAGLNLRFQKDSEQYRLFLGAEDISAVIRSPEMDMLSSGVSAVAEVRRAMTELQRKIGAHGDLVAEGRDMGTVVFPQAEYKFFLTASPEARAERRFRERRARGEAVDLSTVATELKTRDEQDSRRILAPLRQASDAKLIDTTELSPDQVTTLILQAVRADNFVKA
ncbi:MAG: (d)CMP kinase [Desulfobacteraceae bacterium]|nr:MAG: (d)CMP kinase [Desulfobacteraceae bacterium]